MSGLEGISSWLSGPALLCALVALGFAVGVLTGLFGVGGAFSIVPLLNVALGVPYPLAIGSSLCYTVGASSAGLARHMRLGNYEPRSVLVLAAASMVGAVGGGTLNRFAETALGQRRYTLLMHGLFIVLLTVTAWLIARRDGRQDAPGRTPLQRLPLPPYIDLPRAGLARVSLVGLGLVGAMVGVLAGMMGIGGGVLLIPALVLVVGLSPHQAVGTSLGVVLFSAMAGGAKYALDDHVSMWIVMPLLVSSVFGVQLGAWICQGLQARRLRRYFALLVLAVAAMLAVDAATKLLARRP